RAFLARSASDFGIPTLLEAERPRYEPVLAAFAAGSTLDELARGPDAQLVRELKAAVFGLFYALPDNPNWHALGFPGPITPPPAPRADWAAAGLDGLDGPEFDAHLDAVSERLGVGTAATRPNRTNELLAEALAARGLSHELVPRNASAADDPRFCGYCNAGC